MAARDREGRDTPKSEGRREEDEAGFGPMGREGKNFGKKCGISEVIGSGGIYGEGGRGRRRRIG